MIPNRLRRARLALLSAAIVAPTFASAFGTGPHFDMTRDAMAAEGFGGTAIKIVQVSNWFNDLYEQDESNAYSGHQSWFGSVAGFVGNLLTLFRKEDWPKDILDAAERMHFDSSDPIDTTDQAEAEWLRLARATKLALRNNANFPPAVLCIMGATLHAVQDFYSHTNWTERKGSRIADGFDGPGWKALGKFGTHPTWFDVPAAERAKADIYSQRGKPGDVHFTHGSWDSRSKGRTPVGMNKDSEGRPGYEDAYITAMIASRQWIQAMRIWIGNETAWANAQRFADTFGSDLNHDQAGAFELSWYVGHWNGSEDTKGGKTDIISSGISYFEGQRKSVFRRQWEKLILPIRAVNPLVSDTPVPSSAAIAGQIEFVEVFINHLRQIDDIDSGDIPFVSENDADWYAKAFIAGQEFVSVLIEAHNTFAFPSPNGPMTFIKSVPKVRNAPEPLVSLKVRLRTGPADGAGSDMDLFLRLNDQTRIEFPYGDFDDFERGRTDTYVFPVPGGMKLSDLKFLQLEKGGGGSHHQWQMGGITVEANGRAIYSNDGINRWLNGRNEVFRLPGFSPPSPRTADVPVALQLWDDDALLTGSDDQADISPAPKSKTLQMLFNTAAMRLGGDYSGATPTKVSGAGDSNRAEISFVVRTFQVAPPPRTTRFIPPIRGTIVRRPPPR